MSRPRCCLLLLLALFACDDHDQARGQQRPRFQLDPINGTRIRPGPVVPEDSLPGPDELAGANPYEGNAYAIMEGERLYRWMNCDGCHGDGGGSIGPALWDNQWIYGGAPADIAESIIRGRPNGMPAFAGRLPESEIWKLVAYVQTLEPGGGLRKAGVK